MHDATASCSGPQPNVAMCTARSASTGSLGDSCGAAATAGVARRGAGACMGARTGGAGTGAGARAPSGARGTGASTGRSATAVAVGASADAAAGAAGAAAGDHSRTPIAASIRRCRSLQLMPCPLADAAAAS